MVCSIVAPAALVAEFLASQFHIRSVFGPRPLMGIGRISVDIVNVSAFASCCRLPVYRVIVGVLQFLSLSFPFPAGPCGRPRICHHSPVCVLSIVLVVSVCSSSSSPALCRAPPGLCGLLCPGPRGHHCPPPIFPPLSPECPPPIFLFSLFASECNVLCTGCSTRGPFLREHVVNSVSGVLACMTHAH